MPRRRRVAALLTVCSMLAVSLLQLVASAPVAEAMTTAVINPGGGQNPAGTDGIEIHASSNLQYQVKYRNGGTMFSPATFTASNALFNGVYLAIGDIVVASSPHPGPATGFFDLTFTELSQSAITGTGTVVDPYTLSTSVYVDVDESSTYSSDVDYLLTVDVSYIQGRSSFAQTYTVTNPPTNDAPIKLYHIVDSFLAGGDTGPAYALDEAGAEITAIGPDPSLVGVRKIDGTGTAQFMAFLEDDTSEFAHYYSGTYNGSALFANGINQGGDIIDGLVFSNVDNGFGVQYDISQEAGAHSVSNYFVYELDELPPLAELSIQKFTNEEEEGGELEYDAPISWTVRIENTGDQTIENIAAVDDLEGTMTCLTTTLLPGEGTTCEVTGSALLGPYQNTVTVTGVGVTTGEEIEFTSNSNYVGFGDLPVLTVQKLTNGVDGHAGEISVGDPVVWTYVVTNNSNWAITEFEVVDDPEGAAACEGNITTLPPGETVQCQITGEAVEGEYVNSVVARGVIGGEDAVSATDTGSYIGVAPQCVAVPQADQLVGWWDFDTDYAEKSGSFPAGVGTGGVAINSSGYVNGAADFTGGRVDTTGNLGLGSGDFSVDMWLRLEDGNQAQHTVTHRDNSGNGFTTFLYDFGTGYRPGILLANTPYTAPSSMIVPADGEFHLLAVTVTAAGQITFYLDDLPPATVNGVASVRDAPSGDIKFGQDYDDSSSDSFSGALDEVEIFSSILTAEDVAGLYQAGRAGKCTTPELTVTKTTNGLLDGGDITVGSQVIWEITVQNTGSIAIETMDYFDDMEAAAADCPAVSLAPGESDTCAYVGTAVLGSYTNTAIVTAQVGGDDYEFTATSSYTGTEGLQCPTGLNVLFVIDNSGSISQSEFSDFAASTNLVANELLALGPNVQIAAAHYGAVVWPNSEVYIESDFAHASPTITAKRLDGGDDLGAAMYDIKSALTGVVSPTVVSPIKTFNYDDAYKTHIVVFTDAAWGGGSTWLRDRTGANDWDIYNQIKTELNASLSVIRVQQTGNTPNVAAIGSPGGSYTGATGSNPDGPFNGVTPRRYWSSPIADFTSIAADLASDITSDCYLEIDKTTDGSQGRPFKRAGESVQWDYTVSNTGTVPITGITVNDDKEGAVSCPFSTLIGGQSMTCTALTGTVQRGGYQNTATAIGSLGAFTVSASDTSGYVSEIRWTDYFVGLVPERLLDTRNDAEGEYSTPWGPGETRPVTVLGVGGVPATDVEAVLLNVTTVRPTAPFSWLTIDPSGSPSSGTAAHNFGTSSATTELVNDLVIAKVGENGAIDITNALGTVELVIDVVGYYAIDEGAGYEPLEPARILDTRNDVEGAYDTPWAAEETRSVQVTDVGGVPASGVEAVVLNVTSVQPTAAFSWLTVNPTGTEPATTAAHNFGTSPATTEIVNDIVVAKVGDGGFIDITNARGSVHLVIDVVGYYAQEGGMAYLPLAPERLLDTRNDSDGDYSTPWGSGEVRTIQADQFAGCAAVAVHVTSVSPTAAFSWLTATPDGEGSGTATHNFGTASQTSQLANDVVIAKLNAEGSFSLENADGSVDLVIDLVGIYSDDFTSELACLPNDG